MIQIYRICSSNRGISWIVSLLVLLACSALFVAAVVRICMVLGLQIR